MLNPRVLYDTLGPVGLGVLFLVLTVLLVFATISNSRDHVRRRQALARRIAAARARRAATDAQELADLLTDWAAERQAYRPARWRR